MKTYLNLSNRILAFAGALLFLLSGLQTAHAQESLSDVIRQSGFEWLVGKWTATSPEGDSVVLQYEWDLEKHIVKSHLTMGNTEARGMTVYDATAKKAIYVSADNQGNFGRGEWDEDEGKAVLKYHSKDPYGEERHMAIVHTKKGGTGMTVEIFALDGEEIGDGPFMELDFKK